MIARQFVQSSSGSRLPALARRCAVLAALALVGCGGASSGGPDASTSGDAGAFCEMAISFSPTSPQAPGMVLVDGSIYKNGLQGAESYQFFVSHDDVAIGYEDRDPYDGSKIAFPTAEIGEYRVALDGGVGGSPCADAVTIINVVDPAAITATYRLHIVPAAGQPAPVQERLLSVPGGADYSLGAISLDNGVSASGTVSDVEATPLPGYLRVTRSGAPGEVLETFADPTGGFSARLGPGPYDVLVVPESPAVAPDLRSELNASGLGMLTLTAGDSIAGTVVDAFGVPVVGARVSLRIDGVPSTVATTSATGAFTVKARAGGATAVTVSPLPGTGLPRLDLAAAEGLIAAPGSELAIAYHDTTSRAVLLEVTAADGVTPAPGSRVTWIARPLPGAGTITPAGDEEAIAAGGLRLTGIADEAGQLEAMALPEAFYDVVVEATGGSGLGVALLAVDLRTGSPTPAGLSLAAPATLTGTVTVDQVGVGGVEVTAVPRGLLANIAGGSAHAVSAADGSYSLEVVGGGEYDLWLEPSRRDLARARIAGVVAPAAGTVLTLPDAEVSWAISVSGQLSIPGFGSGAGVHVMVLCYDCEGVAARIPVAEAVADTIGRFQLAIPDPGIQESSVRSRPQTTAQ